jgi:HD-like signal output (HDOD) protein
MAAKECSNFKRKFANETDYLSFGSRFRLCSRGYLWFNCSCGSTLLTKKEQLPWFSPDSMMSGSAKSLFKEVSAKSRLPFISSAVMELMQKLRDPSVSVEDLVKLIRSEPVLASSVLETANQRKSLEGQKIESIKHAIVYVGRDKIQESLAIASLQTFQLTTKHYNFAIYSNEAFSSGFVADFLNHRLKLRFHADEVYVAACLANVGRVLQAITYPNEVDAIYQRVSGAEGKEKWHVIERDFLPAGHGTFGEVAAIYWGMPPYIVEAVSGHHDQKKLFEGDSMTTLDLIAVSVQLGHRIRNERHRVDGFLVKRFCSLAKLNEKILDALMAEAATIYRPPAKELKSAS